MAGTRILLVVFLVVFVNGIQAQGQQRGIEILITDQEGKRVGFYKESHALVIGVSDYTAGWPDIESIPDEIKKIKQTLSDHGFKIRIVMNPDAKALFQAFAQFINRYGYSPENRLLFFFSGHGYSRQGGKKGYLVPADAPDPRVDEVGFLRKALGMAQILTWSRQIESKHALFLFDSCFSGTIFKTRALPGPPPHITDVTSRPIRQFISAGSAGEEVPARSVFTPSFIRGVNGKADMNKDGYVTGTELGIFLHDRVLNYRKGQTPQYGKIKDPDLDEGDFVFRIPDRQVSQTTPTTIKANDPELDCWMLVKNSENIDDVRYYLENYPRGKFVIPARLKLQQLTRSTRQPRTDLSLVPRDRLSAEWVNREGNYWIYVNGKPYTRDTRSQWIDNDLLVYIPELKKYFLMEDFKNRSDNTLRPARTIETGNTTLWRNDSGLFWLYVEGESCSDIKSEYAEDHVLAYVPALEKYYLLNNYRNRADNTLRPARYIPSANGTLWRNKKGLFWLYVRGKSLQSEAPNAWINDDLLVFIPATEKYYLLEGFKQLDDNTFRPARVVYSPNNTLWATEEGKYWLFVDGTSHHKGSESAWIGDDLLVYVPALRQYYLMKGYKNKQPGALSPAQQILSDNGTLWRNREGRFWVYIDGVTHGTKTRWVWLGDSLLVFVPALNQYHLLQNFKNRDDNTLRPTLPQPTPNGTLWLRNADRYWLIVDGQARHADSTSQWEGNDLVVRVPALNRTYRFKNYKTRDDNTLRPAET